MQRYRIEVCHQHEVKPGNIVGAIANEAGLDSRHIGRIDIYDDYSLVDLPLGMPREIFQDLKKAWVCGQRLEIAPLGKPGSPEKDKSKPKKPHKKKSKNRQNP